MAETPFGTLPVHWGLSTLGELCESVEDGDWVESKDQGGSDYRLLQVSNIGTGEFRETGNFRYITTETFRNLGCHEILVGDVLIARMPDPVGRAWYVRELLEPAITSVDVAIARCDQSVVDPGFITAYLNSPFNLAFAEQQSSGTTRARITRRDLVNYPVPVPPLKEQQQIAEVLQTFDDLIKNNRKRIELLEKTARLLHQEWFVHFRYPGHENVPILDSELGPIPDGWLATTLDQIGHVTIGGDWGEDTSPGEGWVEAGCLRGVDLERLRRGDSSSVRRRWIKERSLGKRQLVEGDLVVEGSGECGRALAYRDEMQTLVGAPLIYSNFCKRLRLADLPTASFCELLFNEMCRDSRMEAFKTGTTIPNLNFEALTSQTLFVIPDPSSIESFSSQVSPLQAFGLTGINKNLSEARDLLRPRLVSGDLEISDLNLDLEVAG